MYMTWPKRTLKNSFTKGWLYLWRKIGNMHTSKRPSIELQHDPWRRIWLLWSREKCIRKEAINLSSLHTGNFRYFPVTSCFRGFEDAFFIICLHGALSFDVLCFVFFFSFFFSKSPFSNLFPSTSKRVFIYLPINGWERILSLFGWFIKSILIPKARVE